MVKNAKRKDVSGGSLPVQHTTVGRARSAQNARTHGVLSSGIPPHERANFELWAQELRTALTPEGALEQMLAEQVVRYGWRLHRVASWEAGTVGAAHRTTVAQVFDGAEGFQHAEPHTLTTAQVVADLAARVGASSADVLGEDGLALVMRAVSDREGEASAWTRLADADWTADDVLEGRSPRWVADVLEVLLTAWPATRPSRRALAATVWNVARPSTAQMNAVEAVAGEYPSDGETVRRVLALSVKHAAEETRAAFREEAAQTGERAARLQALWARVQAELERVATLPAVPPDATLASIQRYEAHLARQFYRAMHELEALQARRRGQETPLARLDVNGLDRDE